MWRKEEFSRGKGPCKEELEERNPSRVAKTAGIRARNSR